MTQGKTTRRALLAGMAASGIASNSLTAPARANTAAREQTRVSNNAWDAIVVGGGVFGAWTAHHLQQAGKKTLLIDANGPANARASSGGETRMIRSDYGADEIYTKMSNASLVEWKKLSEQAELPLFHQSGVLFFFQNMVDYARASIETHKQLDLPLEVLDAGALRKGFPQFNFEGVEFGLYEVGFGALMARRSVQHLVSRFVKAGGTYRQALGTAPNTDGHSLTIGGRRESADSIIYACGPWMRTLLPELLENRLFVTRQEVAFVAPPSGSTQFGFGSLPGWADWNDGDLYYGFPDIEGRGFKIAHDKHGDTFDPDLGSRKTPDEVFERLRTYMAHRFPALKDAPFIGDRVCQYSNSSNGNFLIDRHPVHKNIIMIGAGSGHGFKHGPEVGRMAAHLALNPSAHTLDRFSLKTKTTVHKRTVV